MPQRRQLTWTELRVGLFVLVGLSVLAAGIFYVTGAGPLSPKYRIKTYLPDASQLARGAGGLEPTGFVDRGGRVGPPPVEGRSGPAC